MVRRSPEILPTDVFDLSRIRVNVEVGSAHRVIDPVAPSMRSKYFKSLKEKKNSVDND